MQIELYVELRAGIIEERDLDVDVIDTENSSICDGGWRRHICRSRDDGLVGIGHAWDHVQMDDVITNTEVLCARELATLRDDRDRAAEGQEFACGERKT